jgi:hypothetical protein
MQQGKGSHRGNREVEWWVAGYETVGDIFLRVAKTKGSARCLGTGSMGR